MKRLRSIQVLRGVAACAVVAWHSYAEIDPTHSSAMRIGCAGVDLFFVISGFIMANVSQGRTPQAFLKDRAWRIYPLWLLAVAPWLIAFPQSLKGLATSLTLWPIYGNAFQLPALGIGWTLSFEMLFYFAVTLALATRPLVPLTLLAISAVLAFASDTMLFNYLGSPIILEFLAGVLIARLPLNGKLALVLLPLAVVWLALAPLSSFEVAAAIYPQQALIRAIGWGAPAALIVYSALSLEGHFANRAWAIPVMLGDASYSIYLFHLTTLWLLNLYWGAELVLAAGLGVAIHFLVEPRITRLYLRNNHQPVASTATGSRRPARKTSATSTAAAAESPGTA